MRGSTHHVDGVPAVLATRWLWVRGFTAAGLMQEADLVAGSALAPRLARFFESPLMAFVHVHNAKAGCFAACTHRA